MNLYRVKGTVTEVSEINTTAEAESVELAHKTIERRYAGTVNITECKSLGNYRTEKWRDLEDAIQDYNEQIQQERAKGHSDEHIREDSCLFGDMEDFEAILQDLINGDFKSAATKRENLDTSPRECFPDRIYNIFENLGLL